MFVLVLSSTFASFLIPPSNRAAAVVSTVRHSTIAPAHKGKVACQVLGGPRYLLLTRHHKLPSVAPGPEKNGVVVAVFVVL